MAVQGVVSEGKAGNSLGDGKHGEDVASEGALDVVELFVNTIFPHCNGFSITYIDIRNVLAHDLLAGVVDENV